MSTQANPYNQRLMAVALIREAIDDLDEATHQKVAALSEEGRDWRETLIRQINGFEMPPTFIQTAIRKRWMTAGQPDLVSFSKTVLKEWGLL